MRKVTVILAATIIAATAAIAASFEIRDNEKPIQFNELPAAAQHFVKQHFAKEEVSYTIKDNGVVWDEYTVVFQSGVKLEFDDKGEWTEVECRYSEVPSAIVPKEISDYVKKHNPSAKIIEIKRDHNEWDVKLTGGLELTFNKSFKLTEFDD